MISVPAFRFGGGETWRCLQLPLCPTSVRNERKGPLSHPSSALALDRITTTYRALLAHTVQCESVFLVFVWPSCFGSHLSGSLRGTSFGSCAEQLPSSSPGPSSQLRIYKYAHVVYLRHVLPLPMSALRLFSADFLFLFFFFFFLASWQPLHLCRGKVFQGPWPFLHSNPSSPRTATARPTSWASAVPSQVYTVTLMVANSRLSSSKTIAIVSPFK